MCIKTHTNPYTHTHLIMSDVSDVPPKCSCVIVCVTMINGIAGFSSGLGENLNCALARCIYMCVYEDTINILSVCSVLYCAIFCFGYLRLLLDMRRTRVIVFLVVLLCSSFSSLLSFPSSFPSLSLSLSLSPSLPPSFSLPHYLFIVYFLYLSSCTNTALAVIIQFSIDTESFT